MNKTIQTILKVIAFFAVGFVILYFVYQRQENMYLLQCTSQGKLPEDCSLLHKLWTDFVGAKVQILLLVIVAFMVSNVSRAIRWQMMLEPLGKKPRFFNAFAAIMAAYLTNLGIPRSGEIVRAGIISRYEQIPFEKAIGTVVLDRIIDVLSLFIMITLAFILSFDHMYAYFQENFDLMSNLQRLFYSPVFLASLITVTGIILLIFYYHWLTILNSKIGKKILEVLKGFLDGIVTVFRLRKPWLFLLHSIVIWLMYYLMTYLCFFAYGPTAHLGPVAGLVVFVFGSLGVVFPSPGGMGSYQFLVGESLGFFAIQPADAFSFANIVFFTIQLFCNILLGILAFILLPILNRNDH